MPISSALENLKERQIAGDREKRKNSIADVTVYYEISKATERKK